MFGREIIIIVGFFLTVCCSAGLNEKKSSNVIDSGIVVRASATPNEYLEMLKQHPEVVKRSDRSMILMKYAKIDGLIFVGSDSVKPPKYEPEPDLGVTPEVLNDFVERNKSVSKIDPWFDVYSKVELITLNGSIEKELKELRRKSPNSEGIVIYSQIGRNIDYSQRLLYVEHYTLTGKVTKEFCRISWIHESNDVTQNCKSVQ